MKHKVTIPVVGARNGAIQSGWYSRSSSGQDEYGHHLALDCLDDEAFDAGYAVVYVEAEIDVEAVFEKHTIIGEVRKGTEE